MDNTALIVIDMQNGFISDKSPLCIDGAAATVPACASVIAACREHHIPVIFVTRVYAADGSDVELTRKPVWEAGGKPLSPGCDPEIDTSMPECFGSSEKDYHIIKPRFSAFFGTSLDLLLRRLGITHVVLAGTTTPNCIRTTCYDAISLDYDVTILTDCTSSRKEEIQRANLMDMKNIGARMLSSETLIASIIERK